MSTPAGKRQKVALITGASSGIGYATAAEFAKRGYKVFAGARRLEPMKSLRDNHGVIIFELDVSNLESVKNAKKLIIEQTGESYLDVLYNNAGQSCTFPGLDVTDEWFKQCYEVNVFGPMRLVRELGSLVINAKGTIGFTGSISGVLPFPLCSTYSSSKAAIHQYAASLRIEMLAFDVKVINIITGGVKTNISDKRDLPSSSLFNIPEMAVALKERQEMAARNNPMSPEEYARRVANDFESATLGGKLNSYRGKHATWLGFWVALIVPRFIIERMMIRKFKLVNIYKYLRLKYSKEKLE
ncbi:1-acyl dihydroxyacetone phosphate reductase [Scheffersomyces xylosifermentans]|uniref:1-acyl dihydroxyacetone phosphate reductase n=1 Tax=Scheffersomyces xylosifermentans TaxID=1304137 RepID=UPI00315DDD4C